MLKPIVDEFNRFTEEKEFATSLSPVEVNNRFLSAVEKGDRQEVENLFSAYAVAPGDMVPAMGLCIAARQGDAQTVRLLLEKGVPADGRLMGKTPAEWAEKCHHSHVVNILKAAMPNKMLSIQSFTRPHSGAA